MGRSQIKYRSGRGRGAGGRGVSGDSGEARGRRSGGRALASNAFRYAEREDGEDEEETGSDPGPGVDMHRQFFAGEQIYRDMGDTKESYFRTKAVQQWEADDDDDGTPEALVAVGVMDFAWIEDQLSKVSPSIRYQIDHIYCTDLKKQQKIEEDLDPQEAVDVQSQSAHGESLSASEGPARSALDDLLVLSAVAGSTTTKPSPSPPFNSSMGVPLPVQLGGNGPAEDLEEWLDDVLDM